MLTDVEEGSGGLIWCACMEEKGKRETSPYNLPLRHWEGVELQLYSFFTFGARWGWVVVNAGLHPGMTGYPLYRWAHGSTEEYNNSITMVGLLAEFWPWGHPLPTPEKIKGVPATRSFLRLIWRQRVSCYGLFNPLKTKKVKSAFISNAARFPKEHCFCRFPGFAHLS